MSKQLQFELWKECNTKCTFCYLGKLNNHTDSAKKIKNLQNAIDILSNDDIYKEYDTIGLIGGEFFQGQLNTKEVYDKFFELIFLLRNKAFCGYVKKIWLNATLAIGKQKDLYAVLDIFKEAPCEIWVLTSYDTLGRFHTKKMFDTWKYHMQNLTINYPNVKKNITSIITGDFILKYLSDEFLFNEYMKLYNCSFFIKLCAGIEEEFVSKKDTNEKLGYFFPKRVDFLKFLKKLYFENIDLYNKAFNIEYRADTLICEYHNENVIVNRDKETKIETYNPDIDYIMKCGHLSIYNCYLDSSKCALCDKELLMEQF